MSMSLGKHGHLDHATSMAINAKHVSIVGLCSQAVATSVSDMPKQTSARGHKSIEA